MEAQAQKEHFFNHFNWNQSHYSSAGSGAEGFALSSLYRNYNDTANYYLGLDVPVEKINSAFGFYYLHNSARLQQSLQTGLSYTVFIPFGSNSSLRLGMQGNRLQHALSEKTWAFGEYQTDSVDYTGDLSLFLKRDKLSLGFSVEKLYRQAGFHKPVYTVLLGFQELRTNDWLRSSPYLLMRQKPGQGLPEWRFNYTATIANFLVLGSSYYKNSDYLYGFNAGFKICNRLWLTAATDFENLMLPYRAIYEFGIRWNIQRKQPEAPFADTPVIPEPEIEEGF